MITGKESERVAGLDGLRALSILSVILTHLGVYGHLTSQRIAMLVQGTTGVNIFFVLSGFLITALLIRENYQTGKVSLGQFYIRRALRILPCFVVFLSLVACLHLVGVLKLPPMSLVASSLYLTNFINRANYSVILGHTWSLAVEEHFYVVWPLLFATLSRKRLFWVSLGVFLVCIPLWIFLKSDLYISSKFFPDRWTLPAGGAILLGCCLAIANEWIGADGRRFSWTRTPGFLVLALALYCTSLWMPASLFSLSVFPQLLGIAGVIYWVTRNPTSMLTRILDWSPIAFMGKISYGLYIWQGFFLTTGPAGAQIWVQRFPQNLILLVVTAVVSFYVIERPFLLMKRQHRTRVVPTASLPAGSAWLE